MASRPGGWEVQGGPGAAAGCGREELWWGAEVLAASQLQQPRSKASKGRPDAALCTWCHRSVLTWELSNHCTPSGLLETRVKSLNLFRHGLNKCLSHTSSVAGSVLVPAFKEPYSLGVRV